MIEKSGTKPWKASMSTFSFDLLEDRSIDLLLHENFMSDDLEELKEFIESKLNAGILNWETDLTKLSMVDSFFWGMLIKMDASI